MNKNIELSVHSAFIDEARGYRFEPLRDKKGKKVYRHPRDGEWYITEDAEIARHPRCEDDERGQILRAIPINPPSSPSCSTCSHEYEPRSEEVRHYDGEECTADTSFQVEKFYPSGKYKFYFTGERKDVFSVVNYSDKRELFLHEETGTPCIFIRDGYNYRNVWIIRAVPIVPPKPSKQWKKGEWAFHPEYKLLYVASETDIHGEPGFIFHPLHSGNTNVIISGHHLDVLREVEDSDWPVGALVMYYYDHLIPSQIMGVSSYCGIHVKSEFVHGFSRWVEPKHIRPLQDSDWIVEIDGVKYRAFEINTRSRRDNIELRQSTSEYTISMPVTPEIVKALGVPVMPLKLQGR